MSKWSELLKQKALELQEQPAPQDPVQAPAPPADDPAEAARMARVRFLDGEPPAQTGLSVEERAELLRRVGAAGRGWDARELWNVVSRAWRGRGRSLLDALRKTQTEEVSHADP